MSGTTDDAEDNAPGYGLIYPFWVDTDAYSDRDRAMFAAGFEFATILRHARFEAGPLATIIHRENESRVRMACGRSGRRCAIRPVEDAADPDGTWSYLTIGPGAAPG
jgi:hypothetical protein